MRSYTIKHVDAFTVTPFAGNYAGVVPEADGLTESQMRRIAAELNLPETAFILPPDTPEADLQIRWFTPRVEVPLCGHATVAGFHALAEDGLAGMQAEGQHHFRLQTKSGILAVRVEKNFHGISVEFELPVPKFRLKKKIPTEVMRSLGLTARDVAKGLPTVVDSYLYLPVQRRSVLTSLTPSFADLARACRREKVLGVCAFTLDTIEPGSSVHSRFFGPAVGIDEDPVTGSANGPLGAYLTLFGTGTGTPIVRRQLPDMRFEYVGEQGDCLGRPGRVKTRIAVRQNLVAGVSIAGEAVTVMRGTIQC